MPIPPVRGPSRPRVPRIHPAPSTLSATAASGDRRATLEGLRQIVIAAIEDPATPPRDLAALVNRAQSLLDQLDPTSLVDGDPVDELRARVERKRAAATSPGA